MTLGMARISINAAALGKWAASRGIPQDDVGYLLHALLCDTYGGRCPRPFSVAETGRIIRVLGYVSDGADALMEARMDAERHEAAACVLGEEVKPLPEAWEPGTRFAFSTTVLPTRQSRAGGNGGKREVDALFLEEGRAREDVYVEWLASKLGDAARLVSARMAGFRLAPVVRLVPRTDRPGRSPRWFTMPEAKIEGAIEVACPEKMRALLTHGVGRHGAFGYGMLLLRRC